MSSQSSRKESNKKSSSSPERRSAWNAAELPLKAWGASKYRGLGYDCDPMWMLHPNERDLVKSTMDLCRIYFRPQAAQVDSDYLFPRKGIDVLARHRLLSLLVPRELGGRGASTFTAIVMVETIARYGDPCLAVVYGMHLYSSCFLSAYYHGNRVVKDVLKRMDEDSLLGAVAASDPATGGHFWYYLSAKTERWRDGRIRLHKFASWLTSAGQADFYVVGAPDPDFHPKNHKEAVEEPKKNALFLLFKNEIRASPESYRAMGLHGNLSGPAFCDAVLNEDRMLTRTLAKAKVTDGLPPGDDFTPLIQLFQCAAHVGLAFGAMDLAKMHASSRVHADTGKMLAEYSLIQEYVGNCLTRANVARFALYCVTQRLDEVTSRNDWSKHQDPMYRPRRPYQLWAHQVKICVAQMSDEVCSDMLRACGGSGYLTSMGLERLLRDTKALWLMAPSVELARRFVGHVALLGKDSLDMFHTKCDYAGLYRELGKMSSSEKRAVAARLLTDADLLDGRGPPRFPGQEKDFENPFNTGPSTYNDIVLTSRDGTQHNPGLHPIRWTRLRLAEKVPLDASTVKLVFAFPNSLDHSGCLPGQYIQVRIWKNESEGETADSRRYYSPVSKPDDYGKLEMVVRLYQDGVMAAHMERLQVGDESLEFRGPCGGFEYYPNSLDYVVVIVAGVGATPGIQLARCIQDDRQDRCKCVLIYANSSATDIIFFGELVERASHSAGRLSVTFVVTDHSNAMPHQLVKEAFVDEEFLKKYLPEDLLSRRFKIVVCGGAGFVVSVLYSLRAMFVPPECLFVYGATGTRYVKAVYGRSAFLSSHKSTEVPYAWQPTSTAMAAAMVSMKSDQCAARLIVGPDGKKRILLGNRDVCRGIRLEGWAKKPNVAHERGGNFYISPDD